ncbi:MAG: serine hydroxymethyltransferase [Alphaproteobacteria bacterium]|nr:MAG: serine hydroxymethyltransferase [Alphaproteobacteria bacterium]
MTAIGAKKLDNNDKFFTQNLVDADPEVFATAMGELKRQQDLIELIASENIVSKAVLQAYYTVFTNKYSEGLPYKRYYGGQEFTDQVETLAIERVTRLFNCKFANVQPHSGAQANQAVFMAFLQPGDTFLAMSLAEGGHLTHGSPVNQSGKWFRPIAYGVNNQGLIDYNQVESLAKEHKPKLIIAGGSAYGRVIDFAKFRAIADSVGAMLMVDMAHFAGLVAGGAYPSPVPHAHVVTSTTHKTLRGPRGGVILSNDEEIAKKINSAVFPGLQGGPLMHVIAAKAVCFKEALQPSFKIYAQQVIDNCRAMADVLVQRGLAVVSGGTDSHLALIDLRPKNLTGKAADASLEHAGITCNKNMIPNDPQKAMVTSGIRIGSAAGTTRGFGVKEFQMIGTWIADVLDGLSKNPEDNSKVEKEVLAKVKALCKSFPIYPDLV